MKINPSSIDVLRSGKDVTPAADAKAKAPSSVTRTGSDRVDLSQLSTQIAALESSFAAAPGFDRARVEAIKQAIVDGRLTVNSEVVAEKMLASALAMLDRSSK